MGSAFPKTSRLLKRHEFVRALKQGRRIFTRHFILYVFRDSAPDSRLGVTVSRKVGNSVVRNRVRRMVREAFRIHRDEWFRAPADLVVIAKQQRANTGEPGVADARMQQVAEELGHALQRSRSRGPTQPRGTGSSA